MIGLTGQISGNMIILIRFECRVTQISPQNGHHSQTMGIAKCLRNFLNLPTAFFRAIIDSCSHSYGAHIERLINAGKQYLIVLVGVRQQFIMIQLQNKWNFVCIFSGNSSQNPQSRCNRITATFYC